MRRCALLGASAVLLAGGNARALAAQQDATLNNLVHPTGYVAAAPGTHGRVVERGTGPVPLVLIPGLGFGGDVFARFATANERRYRMRIVTLAGFGGTPAPPMPDAGTSYAAQTWIRGAAAAVGALVAESPGPPDILVAHEAVGTQVAIRVALDAPQMVGGIVIIGGELARPLQPGQPSMIDSVVRRRTVDEGLAPQWFRSVTKSTWDSGMWSASTYSRDSARASVLWREVQRVPLPTMVRYLLESYAYDPTPEVQRLTVRTLVLIPGFTAAYADDAFASSARAFMRESWDVRRSSLPPGLLAIEVVPDAHMFLMDDQPQWFDERVAAWISGLRIGSRSRLAGGAPNADSAARGV